MSSDKDVDPRKAAPSAVGAVPVRPQGSDHGAPSPMGPGKITRVQGHGPPGPSSTPPHAPVGASPAPASESNGARGSASPQNGAARTAGTQPDLGNYDSATGKHVLVLRTWDDAAIAERRVELQGRLSRTTEPKAREELISEYQAIEWVAHERGLALPKDPGEEAAPQAQVGGTPTKFWLPDTSQGMRAMLEREMAAGTGYESASEHAQLRIGYSTLSHSETSNDQRLIGEQQLTLMDHDAAEFRGAFRSEARHTALSMLDASTVAIDSALRSYGIASGAFRLGDAAHKVARDPGVLDAEVDQWVALSSRLDSNRTAFAGGHGKRDDLTREAKQLRDLQDSIAALSSEHLRLTQLVQSEHPQHPGLPWPAAQPDWRAIDARAAQRRPMQGSAQNPFEQLPAPVAKSPEQHLEFVRGALRARRAQFQAAWIEAERQHPVLAAYRGTKAPDASSLTELTDAGSDEATMRSVVHHVLPKLGNIYRTKAALLGGWGTLDPLQLAPAVELTKQRMFVPQGSTRDRVVHDMVAEARDKHDPVQWALEAVMLGLTLITLVPTGGASAAAGLALTGLSYDLYMGMGEYQDAQTTSAAADTDLDKLRSLSDLEPSLTPLLTRIVSAGINLTVAAGLFKRAIALRRATSDGQVDARAIASLNQAGDESGIAGIGDEAVQARAENAAAQAHRSQLSQITNDISVRGLASRPKLYPWRPNPDGAARTLDEAVQIAQAHGVEISSDVYLRARPPRTFKSETFARYFQSRRGLHPDARIKWSQFFQEIEGDEFIPVDFNEDILRSDEAIVAVFAHEMYEINKLRTLFAENGGSVTARQLWSLIDPAANGRLHEEAWDEADKLVRAMRGKGNQ